MEEEVKRILDQNQQLREEKNRQKQTKIRKLIIQKSKKEMRNDGVTKGNNQ